MTDEIFFKEIPGNNGAIGEITLNRPKALNALTHTMVNALTKQLAIWAEANTIKAVVIRAAGDRAFCAGGDIRHVYEAGKAKDPTLIQFFWDEYRLNHQIHHFPKPYIALLDGITMGGGVGISIHGSHRIATERLSFAMPETGIGFFPDVGGSYFLPRCPGKIGFYLGLTGARLKATDALYTELVNATIPSQRLNELVENIANTPFDNNPHRTITKILQAFHTTLDETARLTSYRELIDHCFASPTVTEIISRLREHPDEWSQQTAVTLTTKSPTSLAVTLQQLQKGATLSFDDCMRLEYRLVQRFLQNHDFYEGVRAVIIDKDQTPKWQPSTLNEISTEMIAKFFAPLKNTSELHF